MADERPRRSRTVVLSNAGHKRKRSAKFKGVAAMKPAPKTTAGQYGPQTKIGIRSVHQNEEKLTVTLTGRRPLKDDPNKVELVCSSQEHATMLREYVAPEKLHDREHGIPCYQERFSRTSTRSGAVYRLRKLASDYDLLKARITEANRKKRIRDAQRDGRRREREMAAAREEAMRRMLSKTTSPEE